MGSSGWYRTCFHHIIGGRVIWDRVTAGLGCYVDARPMKSVLEQVPRSQLGDNVTENA